MITNGKDLDFGQSAAGLPNVADAIMQFFQPVTVGIISSTQVNGRTQTIVSKYIETRGVRIEDSDTLTISKTGERYWDTAEVYFLNDISLSVDDLFLFNKLQYRVVGIASWPEYGFNHYNVQQDYTKLYAYKPTEI